MNKETDLKWLSELNDKQYKDHMKLDNDEERRERYWHYYGSAAKVGITQQIRFTIIGMLKNRIKELEEIQKEIVSNHPIGAKGFRDYHKADGEIEANKRLLVSL